MSLRSLLKRHYFSVQTNIHTGRDSAGALKLRDDWATIHENLQCHLQAVSSSSSKGRNDVITTFGKPELELSHVIWHNSTTLDLSASHRLLIAKNAEEQIDFTTTLTKDDLRIFDVVSPREPVVFRQIRSKTLFEIYLMQNPRASL